MKQRHFEIGFGVWLGLGLVAATGCGTAGSQRTTSGTTYDFYAALEQVVTGVIEATYVDLRDKATALKTAVETLAASPTEANLAAARAAWVAARVPWEQSEAFLFGPVSDLALDPAIDSWPVDRVQLDQVLASGLALTAESIAANFGGGLRGFHTVEYLLWGADHVKAAAALAASPREIEYLVAASKALEADVTTLADAWSGAGGYGVGFASAGKPGGRFYRQLDAVQQLLNGMVEICNEVANGKIADPYKAQDPRLARIAERRRHPGPATPNAPPDRCRPESCGRDVGARTADRGVCRSRRRRRPARRSP